MSPTPRRQPYVRREPQDWVTICGYAEHFGISRNTVYKWLREGLLDTYQSGKIRRVKKIPPRQCA